MSYRSYVPWTKSGPSSSYSSASSKSSPDVPASGSATQHEGGYSRRRLASGAAPTSSTPSYKSSYSTPARSYSRDRSSTRDGPAKYTVPSSAGLKEAGRLSLKDKYATGTFPGRSKEASLSGYDRKDSDYVRRNSSRSRDPSPEVSDLKSSYVSTLSPFRLYGRSSYSRSTSREDPTSALRLSTTRYGGSSTVRSPVSDKPPAVYGRPAARQHPEDTSQPDTAGGDQGEVTQTTFVTVVTRGTSPTPPSTSSFLRSRRAEMSRSIEKTVARPTVKPKTADKEMQSDRGDDTSRTSRYAGRVSSASCSPWSSYLDRYGSSYVPTPRYSPRYGGYARSSDVDTPAAGQGADPRQSSDRHKVPEAARVDHTTSPDVENLKHSLKSIAEKSVVLPNDVSRSSLLGNSCSSSNDTSQGKNKESVVNHTAINHAKSSSNVLNKSPSDYNSQTSPNTSVSKTASINSLSASPMTPSPSKTKAKQGSPESTNRKPLPPPIPKVETNTETQNQQLKASSSLHALNKLGIPNKDFRKSALNVELNNVLQAEAFKKMQEKQRKAGKHEKNKRSNSVSSGESESLSVTGGSVPSLSTSAVNSTNKLRESKSLSKLHSNDNRSHNKLNVIPTAGGGKSGVPASKKTSGDRVSSSSESTSSDETSSESSSSSSSETSSSDEETERSVRVRRRGSPQSPDTTDKGAPSSVDARCRTGTPASSADEPSAAAEKPPRPPASPRAQGKTDEAKSFLMRALAPVTNLFKGKSQESLENHGSEILTESKGKTGSNQSLNNSVGSDQENVPGKKPKSSGSPKEGIMKVKSQKSMANLAVSDKTNAESEKRVKPKFKLRKQESGERAWWLDSNPNIPEGVQRIASNVSLNNIADSENQKNVEADNKKTKNYKLRKQESGEIPWWLDANSEVPEGIQRIKSSHSVAKLNEQNSKPEASSKKDEIRKYNIRHQQSGEKAWWMKSSCDIPAGAMKLQSNASLSDFLHSELKAKVQQVAKDKSSTEESTDDSAPEGETSGISVCVPKFPLSLVASPAEVGPPAGDASGRRSPYDNLQEQEHATAAARSKAASKPRPKHLPLFIGSHTNIDDILGSAATLVNPLIGLSKLRRGRGAHHVEDYDVEDYDVEEVLASQVRVHDSMPRTPSIQHQGNTSGQSSGSCSSGMIKLDDTALQLYKDGDYGSYLDLEASISEQHEEFDGFQANRKNSIVLRTQLSVRVHTIIEKLLNSEGRELRRALFSLKQIFQEDKDLVHEFVQNDGLACLIKVGCEADQNYQNYILRALGQVMLYVDGMNGVMEHNETVQWLYALIASKFRLVVKTALKLLLVFVEYVDANCLLLIRAVHAVDQVQGRLPWSNIMRLLKDYDAADTELLIYAMTLVNKSLNGVPDQDTYYDQVDALEEQGVEGTIQRYMSKQGTDLDLLRQFQIYEAVLHHEDGEEKGTPLRQLDDTIRKTLRHRKGLVESAERRKSRRHSTGTAPVSGCTRLNHDEGGDSSSSRSSPGLEDSLAGQLNGSYKDNKAEDAGVTPALRRRRERAERQRSFIREQQETAATLKAGLNSADGQAEDGNQRLCQRLANGKNEDNDSRSNKLNRVSSRKDLTPLMNAVNKLDSECEVKSNADTNGMFKKPWMLSMMYGKSIEDGEGVEDDHNFDDERDDPSERKKLLQLKRENTVKDLTQKLANQNGLGCIADEGNKVAGRMGDMTGLISKAKEGLEKSKSKADVQKSPTGENIPKFEVKKSETELHWEELVKSFKRPLSLCDLDFTDLMSDDEIDILSPTNVTNGVPPPPPPVPTVRGGAAPPPPPPSSRMGSVAPPPMPASVNGFPSVYGTNSRHQRTSGGEPTGSTKTLPNSSNIKKTKKTVKLFWKEVRDDPIILAKLQNSGMIWDELNPVAVDTQKLEHLFESRAKDLITKKQQELNKSKELIVLDHKRSNAINIGMTKLPPPRSIKTAILKMDATIMNREGIEKLLTMLPTEEERSKIQEAQMANPEVPLGSAEQFLLTLASVSELPARLKLWAFKLDFENSEKEIAEPLMDLKQGMEILRSNATFRGILSTLLSIGVFLNGNEVKGFQIEYLAKVPEVKDTVHKHTLLHHLCNMVMEKFPESTDLYSEIGPVTRASKVDFDELASNILKLEQECKASWDHLKVIAKHDISIAMRNKMSEFLADCAERIIVLDIVHRRVMNRFHKLLLWLGIPMHRVHDMKPNELCRIVSEFSLEYRTTRERVLQQLEKKANHRERNKTRGKMITEVGKFRTKEDRADAELRQLLGSDISDAESIHGTLPWRRQRKDISRTVQSPLAREDGVNGHLTDGDDEILESLVKTATKAPSTRATPRERKRTRHADRKSLRRTLKNGLSEEEKKHLAAYIKGY